MTTLPVYLTVHEPTMMAASVEFPTLGLRVASRAEAELKPSLGLPFGLVQGSRIFIGAESFGICGDVYIHVPYVDVDMTPTHAAALLEYVRRHGWRFAHGPTSWVERLAHPRPVIWSDVAPPVVAREPWEIILHRYVVEQRNAVVAVYDAGSPYRVAALDGLLILLAHVGRPSHEIEYTVCRRIRAEQAMRNEGAPEWTPAAVQLFHLVTRQVMSGGEIVKACLGCDRVPDKAKERFVALAAAIEKEGQRT